MSWLSRRDLDGWLPFFPRSIQSELSICFFLRVRWVCERCTSQFDKYEGGRNFYSFTFLFLLFFVFRRPLHLQLPSPSASFPLLSSASLPLAEKSSWNSPRPAFATRSISRRPRRKSLTPSGGARL